MVGKIRPMDRIQADFLSFDSGQIFPGFIIFYQGSDRDLKIVSLPFSINGEN